MPYAEGIEAKIIKELKSMKGWANPYGMSA